jgi:hypothetical protein
LTRRNLALAIALATLMLVACTPRPNGSTANATPYQVYDAGPTLLDVRTLLGSSDWWPATPSFGVRPLNLPSTPENVRFSITQHYIHLGTGEDFTVVYVAYATVSDATAKMTSLQAQIGTNAITSPKAGDQVMYAGQRQASSTALYETDAFIRVGQVVMVAALTRGAGFAGLNEMGRIANKLVSRLKDVLSGKVKASPTPSDDAALLPPAGTDVTLVGSARLPVEAAASLLGSASPQTLAATLHQLGVSDFVFADYALNADLQMEVRASVFTFTSPSDAAGWLDILVGGKANLDQNGVASGYSASTGQYYAFFASGSHAAILFCDSVVQFVTASRACEVPLGRTLSTWQSSLSGG